MAWRTMRGRSGADYDFEAVSPHGPLPRVGGLFLVCAEDEGGTLQDLAVGIADDFGLSLTRDNLPSILEQCGVTTPAPSVVIGVYPAGQQESARVAADIDAALC